MSGGYTMVEKLQGPTLEEKEYLQRIIQLFRANPDSEELTPNEKILLKKILDAEKEAEGFLQQASAINKEVEERQNKLVALNQKILHKNGQLQAFIESLLATR